MPSPLPMHTYNDSGLPCFLTSFAFRLGVDRDDDDPERDGGRSVDALLLPGLSLPFIPILSRESM